MNGHDPDQYTEQQSGLEPKSVESQLTDWIDPSVIAGIILEEMADQEVPLTFPLARKVWLDALENLHGQIRASVEGAWELAKC